MSDCLLDQKNSGTVLIEFAICIPILVILLFYAHDLVKLYRYHSQTEFVAQQIVNILQNISQKRENKKISKTDIINAAALANLSIYPGLTRYAQNSKFEFGRSYQLLLWYVQGQSDGSVKCLWSAILHYYSTSHNQPQNCEYVSYYSPENIGYSMLKWSCPYLIMPIKIGSGETKLIVESSLFRSPYAGSSHVTEKQSFGLHLSEQKSHPQNKNHYHTSFNSVVIFTPKPGLFDETPPQ